MIFFGILQGQNYSKLREGARERERDTEKRQWLSTGLLKPQSLRITVTDADDIFLHSQILLQARKDIADMYIYVYMTYVPKVHIIVNTMRMCKYMCKKIHAHM